MSTGFTGIAGGPTVLLFGERAGRNRYFEPVVKVLRSDGVEVVHVTLGRSGPLNECALALGIRTYALQAEAAREYPAAATRLLRILRAHDVDILHASEFIPAAVAGLIPRRATACKRLFHWHQWRVEGNARWLTRFGQRRADLLMAVSEASAALARERAGVPADRVRIAHNGIEEPRGVNEDELAAVRRRLGVDPGTGLVSVVSRLRAEKGIDTLIRAMPAVRRNLGRPVALAVVGDGPESACLRELAGGIDGNSIAFVGHQEDVAPWLRASDVVAVPSYRESFGLSAMEAIASRRPVVASGVEGLCEFIRDGETGTLVPPGEPEALARALAEAIGEPEEAARRAEAGYRLYRERFTIDAMVGRWVGCYRELLAAS